MDYNGPLVLFSRQQDYMTDSTIYCVRVPNEVMMEDNWRFELFKALVKLAWAAVGEHL